MKVSISSLNVEYIEAPGGLGALVYYLGPGEVAREKD
jgi:hypothetical protein